MGTLVWVLVAAFGLGAAQPASAGFWDKVMEGVGTAEQTMTKPPGVLSNDEIARGLREALAVGAERAVAEASAVGGFLSNPAIHIPLPPQLQSAAKTLRMVGLGKEADQFEETLNRAAEKAAGEALPIFKDAVSNLTFEDVQQIWKGGDNAATEYLERETRDRLYDRFLPVVDEAAQQVGVTRAYESLVDVPAVKSYVAGSDLDLDHYVTNRTLDGLFTLVGDEEKKIRTEPVARTTELLQEVFGP